MPPKISAPEMSKFEAFDLVVIGSGPAGHRAALQGAKAGKKVAIIESYSALGGGCVHFGTIPSKSFKESVYRYSLSSRGILGQEYENSMTGKKAKKSEVQVAEMSRLILRKDRVVDSESQILSDQLKRNKVKVYYGHAEFLDPHQVQVTLGKKQTFLESKVIIIAVGARPMAPQHLSIDGVSVFDSDNVLNLKEIPKSMVVLGAGVIGCEYASMFAMAGTKVTLVDKRNEILASVDREIVKNLVDRFQSLGMEIVLGTEATKIETKKSGKKLVTTVHLSNKKKIHTDSVLIAQGRVGNTDRLGLEKIGLKADDRGLIKVDSEFRTSISHIFAVGDVIGPPALAATAMEQGRMATCHAFQLGCDSMPSLFPFGIYTIPEISMIGKTEEQLKAEGADFVVGKSRYSELARGQIVGDRWGILKMLVDRKTLKILGVHIVGDSAANLIHIGQAVMTLNGDVQYFINSVFNYPTFAEAYKTAAFHAVNLIAGATKTK